jgi:FkbM family methyltransferase
VEVLREVFLDDEYAMIDCVPRSSAATIVDLGANVGISVRYWAERFPDTKIVAVEPDENNLLLCRENCQVGGCAERTVFVQAGVGGTAGQGNLLRTSDPWTFRLSSEATDGSGKVRVLTMQGLIDELELHQGIDILKCDIEGAESEMMANCSEWIGRVSVLIIELHAPYFLPALKRDLEATNRKFSVLTGEKGGVLVVVHRLT